MSIKEKVLDITEKIKDFSNSLFDSILNFYEENKKLAILIFSLIITLLILLIILISLGQKAKNNKNNPIIQNHITLTEELIIPNGPEIEESYTISRDKKEKWSDEEAELWFTIPTDKDIEGLKKTNDNLISDIIGAAP